MLRALVGLLLLANLVFYAWSQGWLDDVVGLRAGGDREPERLTRQVSPDKVVILRPGAGSATAAQRACLEAGPFDVNGVAAAEAALQGLLPNARWIDVRNDKPGLWLVYMGSFADREALQRKQAEIARLRAEIEEVALPSEGEFGLSLGRFDDRGAAERALAQFQQRGIRTARVVQVAAPIERHMLRIERAEPALAAQLTALRTDALGTGFGACAGPEGPQR